jgi:hypothetical protein
MIEIRAGLLVAKLAKDREVISNTLIYNARMYVENLLNNDYDILFLANKDYINNAVYMSILEHQSYNSERNLIVNPTFTFKPFVDNELFFVQNYSNLENKELFISKLNNFDFSLLKPEGRNMVIQKNIYNYAGKPLYNYSLYEIIKIKEVLSNEGLNEKLIIEGIILSEYLGALDFAIKKYKFNPDIKKEELFLKKVLF